MEFKDIREKMKVVCTADFDYGSCEKGETVRVFEIPSQKESSTPYFIGSDGEYHYVRHFKPYKERKNKNV